jgi:transcriptional regulator with XRE-family HTH domain
MFGDIIKNLRIDHGITQEELASIMDLSRPTITKYETNERVPDLDTITRLADYFGVSVDYLCGRKPNAKEKAAYEIITMFDRKGLTSSDISSNEYKKLFDVVNHVLEIYCNKK